MQTDQHFIEYALEFAIHELNYTEEKAGNHHLVAAAFRALPAFRNTSKLSSPVAVEAQAVPASYASAYLGAFD